MVAILCAFLVLLIPWQTGELVTAFQQHLRLGEYYLKRNAPGRAANEFESAVHLHPDDPKALYDLGQALRLWGDLNGAEAALRKALQIRPRFPEAHFALGLVLGDRFGAEKEGLAEFEAAVKEDPSFADANFNIGIIYWKANKFLKAEDFFHKAVEEQPRSPLFRTRYGQALGRIGRLQDALRELQTATKLDSMNRDAYYQLALIQRRLGKKADAERTMETVERLQKNGPTAPDIDQSRLNYTAGMGALERDEPEVAVSRLIQALNQNKDESNVRNALGIVYERKGDYSEAAREFRKIIAKDTRSADAHVNLGVVLIHSGDLAGGEQEFRTALKIDPAFAEAYYNLGLVMAAQERWRPAVDFLHVYLRLRPDSARGYWNMARVFRDMGDVNRALGDFQVAWDLDKSRPDTALEYGQLLLSQGKTPEALDVWKEALQRQPINSRLHEAYWSALKKEGLHREADRELREFRVLAGTDSAKTPSEYQSAIYYLDQRKFEDAAELFRKILKNNPDFAAVRRKLALALFAGGKSAEAATEYQRLVANDPDNSSLRLSLGIVLLRSGSLVAAEKELREAIHLNPRSAHAYYQLGLLYLAQNETDRAMQEFCSARRIDPRLKPPNINAVSELKPRQEGTSK